MHRRPSQARAASWRARLQHHTLTFFRNGSLRLQKGTVTTAFPRILNTSATNAFFSVSDNAEGRPPAWLSSPCHSGSAALRAMVLSIAASGTTAPSFFTICFCIVSRGTWPRCIPQITPRVKASSLACDLAWVLRTFSWQSSCEPFSWQSCSQNHLAQPWPKKAKRAQQNQHNQKS